MFYLSIYGNAFSVDSTVRFYGLTIIVDSDIYLIEVEVWYY